MGTDPDSGHVRLAELVAALSLGIDNRWSTSCASA